MRYEDIDRAAMAPCPFCGQQGEYYIEDITDYHMSFYPEHWGLEAGEYQYSVECAECNALYYGIASPDREKAIENAVNGWNHRAQRG